MIVKNTIECRCKKCKSDIPRGDFKYHKKKSLCWQCGASDNRVVRWGFNQVLRLNAVF